ncbi:cytochrome [Streptomyces rimosus]|nr:cytochrome [Streptomyces rimosus]
MFEELLPRLSDTRRTAGPRYVRSNFVNGLKELAVEVTLA